ncbi:hypothetical protein BIW11_03647 [Tropilaelaps mercedesae]|uniref:Uncharacterized protein n=1 Tax=Tropilaelaps mercedesae TaxID=418985 RepID=A0A1V9XI52_9ACAR|nr:hypothetical protein BIW11_03647 [Tropilaelaps mercedesae]
MSAAALSEKQRSFEERMILMCAELSRMQWPRGLQMTEALPSGIGGSGGQPTLPSSQLELKTTAHGDLTLLHLVAALGYSKLMSEMLRWRTDNPSWLLEAELDGLATDGQGNTPLHWACARGHLEIVRQLESLRTGAALRRQQQQQRQ